MQSMRIGKLSELTGVSIETLRFYEKEGLITPPSRTPAGYRIYQTHSIQQILFILKAKGVGFTLQEIKELLSIRVDAGSHTCGEVKTVAETKLADIEKKLTQLNKIKTVLQTITDACCGGSVPATSCSILSALEDSTPNNVDASQKLAPTHQDSTQEHTNNSICESVRHQQPIEK